MPDGRYLSERAWLYGPFFAFVVVISAVILLLPYETVYVRDRTYLHLFLVTVVACTVIFFVGTLYNVLLWMHGRGLVSTPEGRLVSLSARALRLLFSRRFVKAFCVFVKDALYLSKLKGRSWTRWFMHLMILGGFVFMFALDLLVTLSLDLLHFEPMIDDGGWAKLWVRDFGFEVAGAMMLIGLSVAAVRRFVVKPDIVRTELPDAVSIVFLLAVVAGGFILEGMGIAGAIPGHQENVEYSFLGYAISTALPASSGDYYDAAWLVHGVMSALLIAYIPFSKLFHMIASPIAIEVDGVMAGKEASP
ncbi:MAG TPA: respiratory nitrate reductase subunit gamma [Thermoplasmata archaeon]|nr:respiratory nitrate reductase subunit gamma [Thermoplasmata archaeon]